MLPFYIPIYLLAALLIALISYFADITAAVDPKFPFYISLVTFSGYIFTMILTTYQQFNKKNDNFKIDVSLVDKNRQLIIIYSAGQFLATIALLIATRESAFFMLVWLFSLAGALDCLRIYLQELKKYANDFYRADKLKSLAIEETSGKNFAKLIDHGQNIIEVCQASLIKNETHLFNHTANSLTNLFISFYSQFDLQQLSEKDLTTLKYSTNTTVDRCKDLCFLALKLEASTAAQNIIVNLGKIATKAAKITLSLINYPIKVILRIGFKAFDLKNIALSEIAAFTVVEIIREIVSDQDLETIDYNQFADAIDGLEAIIKYRFQQNKQLDILLLGAPIFELNQLLVTDNGLKNLKSREVINKLKNLREELMHLHTIMSGAKSEEPEIIN